MKRKKYYILSGILVISLILLGFGITYSYFAAYVNNNPEEYDLNIQAGDLKISYLDGTLINDTNIIPGWKKYKYFTVKNESTVSDDVNYKIYLNIENSNFFTEYSEIDDALNLSGSSYLTYSLFKCSSSQQNCNTSIVDRAIVDLQIGNKLVTTRSIAKGGIDYYALLMEFPNLSNVNQSQYGTNGKALSFAAYVVISE